MNQKEYVKLQMQKVTRTDLLYVTNYLRQPDQLQRRWEDSVDLCGAVSKARADDKISRLTAWTLKAYFLLSMNPQLHTQEILEVFPALAEVYVLRSVCYDAGRGISSLEAWLSKKGPLDLAQVQFARAAWLASIIRTKGGVDPFTSIYPFPEVL